MENSPNDGIKYTLSSEVQKTWSLWTKNMRVSQVIRLSSIGLLAVVDKPSWETLMAA